MRKQTQNISFDLNCDGYAIRSKHKLNYHTVMQLILFYRNQAGNHTSINTKIAQCEHKGWASPFEKQGIKKPPFKINENLFFS